MNNAPVSSIAAITPHALFGVDQLLADFSQARISKGWRLHGLLQETLGDDKLCEITLIDLALGNHYPITQDLGSCSTACRLNPEAMTEAGAVIRRITADSTDLVIFNRFGKQESEGRGFAAEMLELMSQEIPVLTVVQDKYLEAWRHFTGDMAIEIPADRAALDAWFDAISAART